MKEKNRWIHSIVRRTLPLVGFVLLMLIAACGKQAAVPPPNPPAPTPEPPGVSAPPAAEPPAQTTPPDKAEPPKGTTSPPANPAPPAGSKQEPVDKKGAVQVVAKPNEIAVLVNKTYALPNNFKPDDLVEPDIPFIFKEKLEKRLMRKEAAAALEKLVAGAKKDGVSIAGVSGYRSQATQKSLFDNYVKRDGEEAAKKYSAVPGHSEHQTGLAMDVSGSDGKCAAQDCFAGTKEAKWLEQHAPEYGFIIRYPKGKEQVTGYQYEPWHLRYVGTDVAKEIAKNKWTLEEYAERTIAASK